LIKKILIVFFTFFYSISFGQTKEQTGYGTYYADKFHGRKTSSGEAYNKNLFTAAHRTLPFNTVVLVTNLSNQKKVLVKINDRGPHTQNRIIDLSKAAAAELDMIKSGVAKVTIEVVDVPPSYLKQDTADNITSTNIPGKNVAVKNISAKSTESDSNKKNTVSATNNIKIFDANDQQGIPQGYGVQIGYFRILNNCKNLLVKMEAKYKISGYAFAEYKTKGTYYRLIMGDFADKKQALDLQSQLEKEIPGCYIVNWNKL